MNRLSTNTTASSLTVKNNLRVQQFLFVDFIHVAVVPAHGLHSLELNDGFHTITCSDSINPDHAGVSVSENFFPGFAYEYTLKERGDSPLAP